MENNHYCRIIWTPHIWYLKPNKKRHKLIETHLQDTNFSKYSAFDFPRVCLFFVSFVVSCRVDVTDLTREGLYGCRVI